MASEKEELEAHGITNLNIYNQLDMMNQQSSNEQNESYELRDNDEVKFLG